MHTSPSRRSFLTGAAAVSLAALIPAQRADAHHQSNHVKGPKPTEPTAVGYFDDLYFDRSYFD